MEPSDFTLLVVDDGEENRDVLARRLERRGFKVLEAEDGLRALEVIAAEHVDLVLLDIMMPRLSGLDVLKRLREAPATADLPVIIQSAKSENDNVVEALELGANDYVTKPLNFPVVLARVQAALRSRRPARQSDAMPVAVVATAEPGPGVVLADRYRLESKLGEGNFGAVFRATHLDLDHTVAVKVLQARPHIDAADALARFRREGVAACRVKHPNAVAILDFGLTSGGLAYLVMELLEGRSLEDELNAAGVLSPARCAEILVPVCAALSVAHEANIVHRDIKPANIFLQSTVLGEVPKVLDFGIAKIAGEAALTQKLTVDGYVLGTPIYMAPERFGSQECDGRADVYSLGAMLYQMLVGRPPFEPPPGNPMAIIAMHLNRTPKPLRVRDPGISEDLDRVVLDCLAKNPADRPDAETLGRRFALVAQGVRRTSPIPVRPGATAPATESLPEADTLWSRRPED